MVINKQGIELIKYFEQCKLKAYKDGKGIWTIGWGATFYEDGSRVKQGDVITQQKADALFEYHIKLFSSGVTKMVKTKLNSNQYSALVSFAFNCGLDDDADTKPEGLGDSTLLKLVNANPNNPAIRNEFMKWISKGTVNERGLTRRRKMEADLYFKK